MDWGQPVKRRAERPEYAAAFSPHLGVPLSFYDMPFDQYRALGVVWLSANASRIPLS